MEKYTIAYVLFIILVLFIIIGMVMPIVFWMVWTKEKTWENLKRIYRIYFNEL